METKLTQRQRSIVLGTLLGDGFLFKCGKKPSLDLNKVTSTRNISIGFLINEEIFGLRQAYLIGAIIINIILEAAQGKLILVVCTTNFTSLILRRENLSKFFLKI